MIVTHEIIIDEDNNKEYSENSAILIDFLEWKITGKIHIFDIDLEYGIVATEKGYIGYIKKPNGDYIDPVWNECSTIEYAMVALQHYINDEITDQLSVNKIY